MNKYIFFGFSYELMNILYSFPTMIKHVEFFVASDFDKTNVIDNIEYIGMEEFSNKIKDYNNGIVIASNIDYSILEKQVKEITDKNKIIYARDWLREYLQQDGVIHIPWKIRMEVSTMCQLNCVGCYMRKNNNGTMKSGYLKFENFKKFIDKNPFIRNVEVSNSGEAFLNPDLKKIIEYAYSKDISITMLNGVNFNSASEDIIETLVKCKVKIINIALDGASQETYEKYRRNGNFDRVLNNIKLVNKYKKKYNSTEPVLKWQYVIMNHNQHEIEKARKLAEENDMIIDYRADWSEDFKPDNPEKVSELVGYNILKKDVLGFVPCHQLFFEPQINWDGRLLGCCFIYNEDWGRNVFEENYLDVINSKEYRHALLNVLGDNKEMNNPCSRCFAYDEIRKYKQVYL